MDLDTVSASGYGVENLRKEGYHHPSTEGSRETRGGRIPQLAIAKRFPHKTGMQYTATMYPRSTEEYKGLSLG